MTNFSMNWDKQKHHEYTKAWKLAHPDQVKEQNKKARQKYRETHKEKLRESRKRWNEKNPEWKKAITSLWDHRQKGFPVFILPREVAELLKRAKYCPICGVKMEYGNRSASTKSPSIDRKNNSPTLNIKTINIICHRCNSKKGNKQDEEFMGKGAGE